MVKTNESFAEQALPAVLKLAQMGPFLLHGGQYMNYTDL